MNKIIVILHLMVLSSCAPREYMRLTTSRERKMSELKLNSEQLQYTLSHDIACIRDTVSRKLEVDDKGKLKILPTDSVEKVFFPKGSLCIKRGDKAVFKDRELPLGTYRVGSDSFIIIKLRDGQRHTINGKTYRVVIGNALPGKNKYGKVPYILYQKTCEPDQVKNLETVKGRTVY